MKRRSRRRKRGQNEESEDSHSSSESGESTQSEDGSEDEEDEEEGKESCDELVIDLEKNNSNVSGKKREVSDEETPDLPQHCLKVEKKVAAVAAEKNLSDDNVKKILKRVVLNEHVLALVKLKEEELLEEKCRNVNSCELKLTRAKTKELKEAISTPLSWPLPITPVKLPLEPELESIISQDLPDEESDDEYHPSRDDHSDEDKDNAESSSDVDSRPLTPATPDSTLTTDKDTTPIKYSDDGLFKIPMDVEKKVDKEEEVTIALRTRSKLCLSDTPIEEIEELFVPPDINFDDTLEADDLLEGDLVWRDFLQDLPNPEPSNNEEDDDADPEYNVAADCEPFDREELRQDAEVEVSKKELKDLVNELFAGIEGIDFDDISMLGSDDNLFPLSFSPSKSLPQDGGSKWKASTDNEESDDLIKDDSSKNPTMQNIFEAKNNSNEQYNLNNDDEKFCKSKPNNDFLDEFPQLQNNYGINEHSSNCSNGVNFMANGNDIKFEDDGETETTEESRKTGTDHLIFEEGDGCFLPEQRLLFEQQMRQHVQLATQIYLLIYGHPTFWSFAYKQKKYLQSLIEMGCNDDNSPYVPCNLKKALKLVEDWEVKLSEDNMQNSKLMTIHVRGQRHVYRRNLPREVVNVILNSSVFVYPRLLPCCMFRMDEYKHTKYLTSEQHLIALGIEQFYQFIITDKLNKPKRGGRSKKEHYDNSVSKHYDRIAELISTYMMPNKDPRKLRQYIKFLRFKSENPVAYYFQNKCAPRTKNKIIPYDPNWRPIDHSVQSFPPKWIKLYLPNGVRDSTSDDDGSDDECNNKRRKRKPKLLRFSEVLTGRLLHLSNYSRTIAEETDRPVQSRLLQDFSNRLAYLNKQMLPSMPFLHVDSKENVVDESCSKVENNDVSNVKKAIDRNVKSNIPNNVTKQRFAAKARRELEANRAMFLNVDASAEDVRETMYAAAYFDKVKIRLSGSVLEPEGISKFEAFQRVLNEFDPHTTTPCDLYRRFEVLFGSENSDLTEEFLTFLTPGQATKVGRFMDYFVLNCMTEFIEKLQVFFTNKPAQLRKILWTIEKLTEKSEEITIALVKSTVLPLLKGNQYLIDWFLRLFSEEKPPESLTNNGYETIDIEGTAKDNVELSNVLSSHEVLNIPPINDDYGNHNCSCTCHNLIDDKYKNRIRHCLACGTKYIQGRMFVQRGRALRPVHLNWNEDTVDGQKNQVRRLSVISQPREESSRKRPAPSECPMNSAKVDSDDERVSPKRSAKFARTTPSSKAGKKITNIFKQQNKTSEPEAQSKHAELEPPIKLSELETEQRHKTSESDDHGKSVESECKKIETEQQGDSQKSCRQWTRDEDKTILLMFRGEGVRELVFDKIQQILPHRTVDEIRDRFQSLIDVAQKIQKTSSEQ